MRATSLNYPVYTIFPNDRFALWDRFVGRPCNSPPGVPWEQCGTPQGVPLADPAAAVAAALEQPLEYPPLAQATTPGDRVVVVLGSGLPQVAQITAAIVRALMASGIDPDGITILRSEADARRRPLKIPLRLIPASGGRADPPSHPRSGQSTGPGLSGGLRRRRADPLESPLDRCRRRAAGRLHAARTFGRLFRHPYDHLSGVFRSAYAGTIPQTRSFHRQRAPSRVAARGEPRRLVAGSELFAASRAGGRRRHLARAGRSKRRGPAAMPRALSGCLESIRRASGKPCRRGDRRRPAATDLGKPGPRAGERRRFGRRGWGDRRLLRPGGGAGARFAAAHRGALRAKRPCGRSVARISATPCPPCNLPVLWKPTAFTCSAVSTPDWLKSWKWFPSTGREELVRLTQRSDSCLVLANAVHAMVHVENE